MGRLRPQFTIGRGMIVVAVAAVLCWLATDATVGPIARLLLLFLVLPTILMFGTLVVLTVVIDTTTALWRWDSTRRRSPHPPGPLPPSTDGSPR